jgi:hypothetical protein
MRPALLPSSQEFRIHETCGQHSPGISGPFRNHLSLTPETEVFFFLPFFPRETEMISQDHHNWA